MIENKTEYLTEFETLQSLFYFPWITITTHDALEKVVASFALKMVLFI